VIVRKLRVTLFKVEIDSKHNSNITYDICYNGSNRFIRNVVSHTSSFVTIRRTSKLIVNVSFSQILFAISSLNVKQGSYD